MNKFFVVIGLLTLIVGFQNCANSLSFEPGQELVQKVDVGLDDSNTYDGVIEEIADDMPSSGQPATPPPAVSYPADDKDYDDKDDRDYASAKGTHVCVLAGKGKSIRLGMTSGEFSSDPSTVNDVCMSRKACEEIVSKAFEVKGAENRGYCGENDRRDIVHLSDKQVEDAILKELLKRLMTSN